MKEQNDDNQYEPHIAAFFALVIVGKDDNTEAVQAIKPVSSRCEWITNSTTSMTFHSRYLSKV